jgi:diguanylate cyclase (GGDEF)-like protein
MVVGWLLGFSGMVLAGVGLGLIARYELSSTFWLLAGASVVFELLSAGPRFGGRPGLGLLVSFAAVVRPAPFYATPATVAQILGESLLIGVLAPGVRALASFREPAARRVAGLGLGGLRSFLAAGLFLALYRWFHGDQPGPDLTASLPALVACALWIWGLDWALAGPAVKVLEGPQVFQIWQEVHRRSGLAVSTGQVFLAYLAVLAALASGMPLVPGLAWSLALVLGPALGLLLLELACSPPVAVPPPPPVSPPPEPVEPLENVEEWLDSLRRRVAALAPADAEEPEAPAEGPEAPAGEPEVSPPPASETPAPVSNGALHLAELLRLSRATAGELTLMEAAEVVVQGVAEILPSAQTVALFLSQGQQPELKAVCVRSPYEAYLYGHPARDDEGILGAAIAGRQALLVPDTRLHQAENLLAYERSALAAPLFYGGRLLGCLYVGAPREGTFSARERDLAEILANQAALCIVNASLLEGSGRTARSDPLTGLCSRAHFKTRLPEEMAAGLRRGQPLALILVGVDRLDRVRRSLGAATADRVLKDVASLLQEVVPSDALVARYGPEEFALLVGDCPRSRALEVAARACQAVGQRFSTGVVAVTASLGVALCPEDAHTVRELVGAAEDALEEARAAGGGQVRAVP